MANRDFSFNESKRGGDERKKACRTSVLINIKQVGEVHIAVHLNVFLLCCYCMFLKLDSTGQYNNTNKS